MDVKESNLRTILEGSKQYVIPLYQRPYAWGRENWQKLWEDLEELMAAQKRDSGDSHFTGTLVLDAGSVTPELTQFLVVDGQQRLTTLSVLLAVIAKFYEDSGDVESSKRIREQVLINPYAKEPNRYRLKPANFDEVTYRSAVEGSLVNTENSKIDDAYLFFQKKLSGFGKDIFSIQDLETAVLVGLKFVTITTSPTDNVYRIFESINNTGIELTQADLIRNLVFMRLGADSEYIHGKYWLPMQKGLSSHDLETVFWIDSLWRDPEVRRQDTYAEQKELISALSSKELETYLERIKVIADCLKLLIDPEMRKDSEFRSGLSTIAALDLPGAQVLVVRILFLAKTKSIEFHDAIEALHIVESYLIRRVVASVPVNSLGRTAYVGAFGLHRDAAKYLHTYLSTGQKKYITDSEIRRIMLEEPMYGRRKFRLLLELLLQKQQGKEILDMSKMQIEHVLPQKPTDAGWDEFANLCDSDDVESIFDSVVNTIGNLTLTEYNPSLSNSSFSVKKDSWLGKTGVTSTQLITENENWGPEEIRSRSRLLSELAISTWVGPDESLLEKEPKAVSAKIDEIVQLIPKGKWTSYGDIAEAIGTASMVVGNRVAGEDIPGAWRVLKGSGRISKHFKWNENSEYKGQSPVQVLTSEGVEFIEGNIASPEQRLSADDLRDLTGEE
jgi:alkylated DNA nucleotide flippase Atl1